MLFTIFCIVPFVLVLSSSFTAENYLMKYGYNLIPRKFDITAYKLLLMDATRIVNGYKITILVTLSGTFGSLIINALIAYPMSLKRLKYRKAINIYTLITILFNGGMVPWYIVCVNFLHLQDKIIALIIPYLCQAWNVFLLRSYFQSLPEELSESAKIDGAGEYRIFFQIILPLSKPVLATVGLFIALMYWNDWWLGIMLLNKTEMQPLQLLLRSITSNIQSLQETPEALQMLNLTGGVLPSESIKMATCMVTVGPIILIYPFVQRYFIKGLMIGAIKG
jgi:ABC-type sugar transport system, permease component